MSGRHFGYVLGLALMVVGAVGCGPPMGTLTEGVAGPISYPPLDLTELSSSTDTVTSSFGFYVQACVNNVLNGDIITARMNDTKSVAFTSIKDGDVGLTFHFTTSSQWTKGRAWVTVVHNQRGVGRIDFTVQ